MRAPRLLGAAAIAASALATPAMAQAVIDNPGRCAAASPNANCRTPGQGNPYADSSDRGHRVAYRHATRDRDNDWNRAHTGFRPTDVAGNVAAAAIGTAGAIATAPFRAWDDAYAYDNSRDDGYRGPVATWDHRSYAERNGFVCTPGTTFRGEDGRRHLCQ
ncbi:hypothetical protein [Bradyrhizobium sp.]|uniref:hypothetical protein n=1 Tax=Bradyrhizobium sp. TaxID=376 RepID=UPI0023A4A3A3|nr:hypothetical protein [Bradyrhizobium sp.]MDE2377218.1 hypothetical protein [Bradyrhizobium sp.]